MNATPTCYFKTNTLPPNHGQRKTKHFWPEISWNMMVWWRYIHNWCMLCDQRFCQLLPVETGCVSYHLRLTSECSNIPVYHYNHIFIHLLNSHCNSCYNTRAISARTPECEIIPNNATFLQYSVDCQARSLSYAILYYIFAIYLSNDNFLIPVSGIFYNIWMPIFMYMILRH